MKTFSAKQLHDNPSEVYRAAVKGPVKVTHKHHGSFIIYQEPCDEDKQRNPCGWGRSGSYGSDSISYS